MRLATITLNTLTSIVGVVLSPEDVCQIGTIGAKDPLAGLAALAAKMFATMPKRSAAPRFTQVVTQAFNAIGRLVSDNLELVDTQVWAKYQDAVARHGAYAFTSVAADRPSVQFVADWFIALSRALPAPTQPEPVVAQPDSVLASMPGQNASEPTAGNAAKPPPAQHNPQQSRDATTEVSTAPRADKSDSTRGHLRPESAKAQTERLEASRHVVWALLLSESACLLYTRRRRIVRTGWDTDFLG